MVHHGLQVVLTMSLAAAFQSCGAIPKRPDPREAPDRTVAASCTKQVDTVARGLVDAGYRITSRYDPNSQRPGVVTAESLSPEMDDVTVMLTCDPDFGYRLAGAGVFGLAGKGQERAKAAIEARLAGTVATFARREADPLRARPATPVDLLVEIGVATLEVELRNDFDRPLVIHAGAIAVLTDEGTLVAAIDPARIGDRLAARHHRLERDTVRLLTERQLHPARLAPGERTAGLVYFDGVANGRVLAHALTEDLEEVTLVGRIRSN